eukprot:2303071-Amphidinium_carterae.1
MATDIVGSRVYKTLWVKVEQVGVHPELGQYPPDTYRLPEREGGDEVRNRYDVSEHTLQYLTHLP